MASTACYVYSSNFLYVDLILTSQETLLWAFTIDYGDNFTSLYVDDVYTSQEALKFPRHIMGSALIFICR
jgi:hypothetical protein